MTDINDDAPQTLRLSDLVPKRLTFEFEDRVWEVRTIMELDIPDIAKADHLGKQITRGLRLFQEGKLQPDDPEGVDLASLKANLVAMTVLVTVDIPEDVLQRMKWVEQLVIMGLFQRGKGPDFLLGRLGELLPPSEPLEGPGQKAAREVIRNGASRRRRPTSATRPH